MAVTVNVMNPKNTHHLKLSKSGTEVGLILCDLNGNATAKAYTRDPMPQSALKIMQGEQEYSDLQEPWTDLAMKDWSGGRGSENLDDDKTKYWDGNGVDTTRGGQLILGPMAHYAKGVRNWEGFWPYLDPACYQSSIGDYTGVMHQLMDLYNALGTYKIGMRINPSANWTTAYVWLWLKRTGSPGALGVHIYSDSGGSPNASLISTSYSAGENGVWSLVLVSLAQALTSGTVYWVVLVPDAADNATNHWSALAAPIFTSNYCKAWTTSWVSLTNELFFRVTDTEHAFKGHFAMLKNSLVVGCEYLDGGNSKLLFNGTAGVATAGAANYVRDSNNMDITNNRFEEGGLLYLWNGRGSNAYRKIQETKTTNREIDVSPNWDITPDTTTEYAVVDTDVMVDISTAFLGGGNKKITHMLGANGAVYIACGDAVAIRRLRHYLSGGSYFQFADESVNATLLAQVINGADNQLWAANRSLPPTIQAASGLDCTGTGAVAALTFGSTINVGDMGVKITNILSAGENFARPHVLKENGIYEVIQNVPFELRIAALPNVRDGWNGIAACVNDVYLYFSFLDSVERYYRGQLDDMGPNQNGALPSTRRGRVACLMPYAGRNYAAIDGGSDGYSSITCHNGQGWHEIFRAPATGLRIMNLFIQPIPGRNVDRLWFSMGSDICWIPIAIDPYHFNNSNASDPTTKYRFYAFAPSGNFETAWVRYGLVDISKLFNAIRFIISPENTNAYIAVWYKLDSEVNSWVYLGNYATSTINRDILLDSATYNITGRQIRFRFQLDTIYSPAGTFARNTISPRLLAIIVEALASVEPKYMYTITFRAEDEEATLNDQGVDDMTADAKLTQLRTWAADAGAVLMNGCTTELNGASGRYVKVDATSARIVRHVVEEGRNRYVCQMNLYEVS